MYACVSTLPCAPALSQHASSPRRACTMDPASRENAARAARVHGVVARPGRLGRSRAMQMAFGSVPSIYLQSEPRVAPRAEDGPLLERRLGALRALHAPARARAARLVAAAALDEGPALALPELPTSKKGVTASTSWSGAQYFSALSAVQLACAAALTLWLVSLRDQPCAPCGAGAGGDGGRHERQRRVPQRHGDAAAAAAAATIHKRAPQER